MQKSTIFTTLLIAALVISILMPAFQVLKTISIILLAFIIIFGLYYQFWFLRNPVREWVQDKNIILSPAYGTVSKIIKRDTSQITVEKKYASTFLTQTSDIWTWGYLINIMMTPLDIHYQRAPLASTLISQKYVSWKFLNAVENPESLRAHFENERNEMTFETEDWFRYKIIQISWYLARRIVPMLEDNQKVTSAETIWLIKLWSQVSIILPSNIELHIQEWDKLIDGVSSLGKIQ